MIGRSHHAGEYIILDGIRIHTLKGDAGQHTAVGKGIAANFVYIIANRYGNDGGCISRTAVGIEQSTGDPGNTLCDHHVDAIRRRTHAIEGLAVFTVSNADILEIGTLDRDPGHTGTVLEGPGCQACQLLRQGDLGKCHTVRKGITANTGQAAGQLHILQLCTAPESTFPNADQAGREINRSQIRTAVERIPRDAAHTVAKVYGFQIDTAPEGTSCHFLDCICHRHRGHIGSRGRTAISVEQICRDTGTAICKGDGNTISRSTCAIEGLAVLRIIQANILHTGTVNRQFFQSGTTAKRPCAQRRQLLGQFHLCQCHTAGESILSDRGQSFRECDVRQYSATGKRRFPDCRQAGRERKLFQGLAICEGRRSDGIQLVRPGDLLQAGTVIEDMARNAAHAVAEIHSFQIDTAPERTSCNLLNCICHRQRSHIGSSGSAAVGIEQVGRNTGTAICKGDSNAITCRTGSVERLAVFRIIQSDVCKTCAVHRDLRHIGTVLEGTGCQRSQSYRQFDLRKGNAGLERIFSNAGQRFGEGHIVQCRAATEGILTNGLQGIGEGDFPQGRTVSKSPAVDSCNSVSAVHSLQINTALECLIPDGSNAVRNRNRGNICRRANSVPGMEDSCRYHCTALVKGHCDSVFRSRTRTVEGHTVVGIVFPDICQIGGFHNDLTQLGTVLERTGTQAGQTLWQRNRGQTHAALKGLCLDGGQTGGEVNFGHGCISFKCTFPDCCHLIASKHIGNCDHGVCAGVLCNSCHTGTDRIFPITVCFCPRRQGQNCAGQCQHAYKQQGTKDIFLHKQANLLLKLYKIHYNPYQNHSQEKYEHFFNVLFPPCNVDKKQRHRFYRWRYYLVCNQEISNNCFIYVSLINFPSPSTQPEVISLELV